jgi:hypothetical protein
MRRQAGRRGRPQKRVRSDCEVTWGPRMGRRRRNADVGGRGGPITTLPRMQQARLRGIARGRALQHLGRTLNGLRAPVHLHAIESCQIDAVKLPALSRCSMVLLHTPRHDFAVRATHLTQQDRPRLRCLPSLAEIAITPYSDKHRPRSPDGEEQLRALYVLRTRRRLAGWPCTPPTRCTASTTSLSLTCWREPLDDPPPTPASNTTWPKVALQA